VALLLLRSTISQMDVPTRQSCTMPVVDPHERSSASGITTNASTIGAWAEPVAGGAFIMSGSGVPFFVAGTLKIVYDLLLFQMFRQLKPPEER
jgi:hypothetical protein